MAEAATAQDYDHVKEVHPNYETSRKARTIWKDVLAGSLKLRQKHKAYLPQFPAEDDDSYKLRVDTSTLFNSTEKTQDILTGLVFQKEITFNDDVSEDIAGTPADGDEEATPGLADNIDNQGTKFNEFARLALEKSFEGFCVILTNAPKTKAQDKAQEKVLALRPYMSLYDADSVINWHYGIDPVSHAKQLEFINFKETHWSFNTTTFKAEKTIKYLVWTLADKIVLWSTYSEDKEGKISRDDGGTIPQLKEIPAEIIGEIEAEPPLLDLAVKNVEHYQTYSDYKSLIHKTNVPMFYTVNLDMPEGPKAIGGDQHWQLAEGGQAGWAEVSGAALASTRTNLEDIKLEMAQLGVSMMASKPNGDITATEALLGSIQEQSALQKQAMNLQDALECSLDFMMQLMGKSSGKGGTIELGATWSQLILSDAQLTLLNSMVNDGNLSIETLLWNMEKSGNLPAGITAEEELERLNEFGETPLGKEGNNEGNGEGSAEDFSGS